MFWNKKILKTTQQLKYKKKFNKWISGSSTPRYNYSK